MPAPPLKAQLAVLALPSATSILPVLLAQRPLDRALDVLRQPQLEQIGLAALLGFPHHRLVADKLTSPRVNHGRWSSARASRNFHRRGEQCLDVCSFQGA